MKQDDIFLNSEGDNWFNRNKDYLRNKKDDLLLSFMNSYQFLNKETKVLEVGCSTGYRLESIQKKFGSRCFGLDASKEAIIAGKETYPDVDLTQGSATELPYTDESFDFVIINFVLHWVDRKNLMRVISELDRVLVKDGLILIGDFYPKSPERRTYHHIKEPLIYTYKQNYPEIFLASGLYSLMGSTVFDHSNMRTEIDTNFDNRCLLALLKKNETDMYAEK